MIDLTGRRMGFWTVVEFAGVHERRARWLCRCTCGDEYVVAGSELLKSRSRRCRRCAAKANLAKRAAEKSARPMDFSPGKDVPDGVPCSRCGLRGPHECLRGDATKGLGAWVGGSL